MAVDVSDLVDEYRKRFDVINDKVRQTIKLMPHTSDELKATAENMRPVLKNRVQTAINELKVQITDSKPLVEEKSIKILTDVYMWSAICLLCSQALMFLAGSGPISTVLGFFFTPLSCTLLATTAIPCATLSAMKFFPNEEHRRTIAFVATAVTAAIIRFQLNGTVLRFVAPPTFVLPLFMGIMLQFTKHQWALQSRIRQFVLCSIPAVVLHLSLAYSQKMLRDDSFLLWMLCSIAVGFVDFQMKVTALRSRSEFSVAIQQYLTCFLFLTFHFALSYVYGSSVPVKVQSSVNSQVTMKTK